ncbi:MAG: Lrp/AsnC ligand binding domain-containing protein [Candidatus Bathyarchaeia archaeon]
MKACILIRVLPGKGEAALKAVRKFPEVKKAYFVFGRYDIIAFADASDYEAVSVLTAKINSIKELKSTESLIEA